MTEKKIRIWLSASVAIVTVILFAFIWLVNLNQTVEIRTALRMYILVLGIFVVAALVLFFMCTEIFDANRELEKSKVLMMTIIMLLIAQVAFTFASYTSQQTNMTFRIMDSAKAFYDKVEGVTAIEDVSYNQDIADAMRELMPSYPEFSAAIVINPNDIVLFAEGEGYQAGDRLEYNSSTDHMIPMSIRGESLILRESKEYVDGVLNSAFSELLTIMAASIFLTVELMLFAMQLLNDRIHVPEPIDGVTSCTALRYVRQIAFLFYFASRLPNSFISVMAKQIGGELFGISGSVLTGIPQSAETLLTCAAIFLTASLMERKGWKVPFSAGLVLVAAGNFMTAFSGTILLFIISRAVTGLGYGFCWMTLRNFALFGRNEEEKAEGFTLLSAGMYAGINCGSVLGSIIAEKLGYPVVLVISAVLTVLCVASVFHMENRIYVKPSANAADDEAASVIHKKAGAYAVFKAIAFVVLMITPTCIAASFINYYLPLYFTDTGGSISDAGRARLLYGLLIIYAGPFFGRMIGRNPGYIRWNVVYNGMIGAGLVLFGFMQNYLMAFACVMLLGLADSFGFAAQNNYFLKFEAMKSLGESVAMSVLSFIKKMAEMLGPIVFGLVIAEGTGMAVAMLGIIFLVAIVVYTFTEIKRSIVR
ncbi:MAG: MFS transporter [Lachnospiraceae bacterium]|nr:MFS transporter [Lachnospiraceae bacterium]